jgi:hypothetical protein
MPELDSRIAGLSSSPTHHEKLPNTIWILWLQGESSAPSVVKWCINSWRSLNPKWRVVVLDAYNFSSYVKLYIDSSLFCKLSMPMRSDLIRLSLMEQQGGVWADATLLCLRPLDEYVNSLIKDSEFFAFRRFSGERVISTWFIVACPRNPLPTIWNQFLSNYFYLNPPLDCYPNWKKAIHRAFRNAFKIHPDLTLLWLSKPVMNLAGPHPYFLAHYIFYYVVSRNTECNKIWRSTVEKWNSFSKTVSRLALEKDDGSYVKSLLQREDSYVCKLSHKSPKYTSIQEGTIIDFLTLPYR